MRTRLSPEEEVDRIRRKHNLMLLRLVCMVEGDHHRYELTYYKRVLISASGLMTFHAALKAFAEGVALGREAAL
jgi:hypothetical protein